MLPILIGAAMGAMKARQEKLNADRDATTRAAEMAYSPWTGMRDFTKVGEQSGGMGALGGAAAGFAQQQNMDLAEKQSALQDEYMKSLINKNNREAGLVSPAEIAAAKPMAMSAARNPWVIRG